MNVQPPGEDELHAYVDGRLPPERAAEVQQWLQAHPSQQQRVAQWKHDAQALRAALAELDHPAAMPAMTGLQQIRQRRRQRRRGYWAMAAACVLALGLGTGLGWQLRAGHNETMPMADAVAAYRLFATGPAPLEFDADRRAPLQDWLRGHFGTAGEVPDFSAQGYRLQGGRLLSTPDGAAAMLVYQDQEGGRIGLYLRPRTARLTPAGERRDGRLLAQYWSEGDTAFALVGPATQSRLRELAPLLRGAA